MSEKQTFESALTKLEDIVTQLEAGEINLDEMIKVYEEGSQLIQFCLKKLDDAEKKIQVLTGEDESNLNLEPFEEAE